MREQPNQVQSRTLKLSAQNWQSRKLRAVKAKQVCLVRCRSSLTSKSLGGSNFFLAASPKMREIHRQAKLSGYRSKRADPG